MTSPRLHDNPIYGTGREITVSGSEQTLEEMGVVFSPLARLIRVRLNPPMNGQLLGRYTHDTAFTVTADDGAAMIPGDPFVFNRSEFQSKFIAVDGDFVAMTEQFGIIIDNDYADAYAEVLAQHLPKGFAWFAKCLHESNMFKVLFVSAKMLSEFNQFVDRTTCEFFASRAKLLRDNHFAELFDNDIGQCLAEHEMSDFEEVQSMIMKVISKGARTAAHYIEIAEIVGLEIEVTDSPPDLTIKVINANVTEMEVCTKVCSKLTDGPDANLILALFCIFQIILPAHLNLIFMIDDCTLEID